MRTLNPQKHTERKQSLVKVARDCFGKYGVQNTSTAELCKDARISSGTLFHYFKTKDEIILAVALDEITRQANFNQTLLKISDFKKAIGLFLSNALIHAQDERNARIKLSMLLETTRLPKLKKLCSQYDQQTHHVLNLLIVSAKRNNILTFDMQVDSLVQSLLVWLYAIEIKSAAAQDASHLVHQFKSTYRCLLPPTI